jgi:hypothetical protein
MRDVKFGIEINLKGAQTVTQATNQLENSIRKTEARYRELAASGKLSLKQQTAAATAMRAKIDESRQAIDKLQASVGNTAVAKYAQNIEARRTLGIRAEKDIQREIQQTESAYQRLAKSGVVSARELSRAQEASLARVRELRRELGETEKVQKRIGISPGAITAAAGAYMLAKPAVTRAMDYDRTVAGLTNTMFNDRDASGRISGKAEIKKAIQDALKFGGGTREQAAGTLSALMSSGEFGKSHAYSLLGTIQKASTATGADSEQLANIALAAKRMGIKPEDIPSALSKAIRAGELGGFELVDMAKHLPAVLSSSRALGLSGMGGFERILASMQASVLTAGTKDEAANNLINMLEKLNGNDTNKDFQKRGIDLRGELAKGAARGEDAVTTFTKLIDVMISRSPKMRVAAQELDRLTSLAQDKKNPLREQALKQIAQIYASAEIGTVLQDRQALQGFRAESQGGKSGLLATVRAGLLKDDAQQELSRSFAVMNDTASVQAQRLANANLEGQDIALTSAGGVLKPFTQGVVAAAEKFPLLTASVTAATASLGLLAGAAGINAMTRGKGAAVVGVANTRSSRMMGKFGLTAAVAGASLSQFGDEDSAAVRYGSAALSGAGLGAMFGPIGAIIGAAGGLAIQGVVDSLKTDVNAKAHIKLDVNLPPGATVRSHDVNAAGNLMLHTNIGNLYSVP